MTEAHSHNDIYMRRDVFTEYSRRVEDNQKAILGQIEEIKEEHKAIRAVVRGAVIAVITNIVISIVVAVILKVLVK